MIDKDQGGWLDYEERLVRMYPHFSGNLARKHLNLGKHDRRLCAYTLLELSVEAIADVTGSHVPSIYSALSKLWPKLGLSGSDMLLPYLHSLTSEASIRYLPIPENPAARGYPRRTAQRFRNFVGIIWA